jgi:hypothetical protein
VVRAGATVAMRPFRTMTVASRMTVSRVIGTTFTFVIAMVPRDKAPRDA